MTSWVRGRSAVNYLLEEGRLEPVAIGSVESIAEALLARAELRLSTASAAAEGADFDGAYVAAYDAYRMAAESLLARQGLRASGGEGSHAAVEDSVSAQFATGIESFAKPVFERFRRTRHSAQYFDPEAPEITDGDTEWAIETAQAAVVGAAEVVRSGALSLFDP